MELRLRISFTLILITPINKLIIPKNKSKAISTFKLSICLKNKSFLIVIIIIKNEIVMKFVLRNDKTTTKDILVRNQKSSGKSLQVFVIVYKAFSIAIKVL